MLGHGRPRTASLSLVGMLLLAHAAATLRAQPTAPPPTAPPAETSYPAARSELGLLAPTAAPAAASVAADLVTLRLRIEWGGGPARTYSGTIQVAGGQVGKPQALGLEIDEPGSIYSADDGVAVAATSPRTYDGVDVSVTAPRGAKLLFDVRPVDAASEAPRPPPLEIPLAEVLNSTYQAALDEEGNRLSIRRAPGDRLQVALTRDSLIFAPGEQLDLNVVPHLLGLEAGTALKLKASIVVARQTKELWTDAADLAAPADDAAWPRVPLAVRVPDDEGVYDLKLELAPQRLGGRLYAAEPLERRSVQFVVLSPQPPARPSLAAAPPAELLEEIDPTSPGWWERVKSATLPAALRHGPLGNCRIGARRTPVGLFVELPPSPSAATGGDADLSWQAYPLSVARPGVPHFVEIEYPADVPQAIGVSLVEPNAAGAVLPLGVDQAFHVNEADAEATPRRAVRRFVVWPKSTAPLIVVMNRRDDAPALYGKIRILGPRAAPLGHLVALPWNRRPDTRLPHAHLPEARADGRLLAAYFDRPLFCENFSNDSALDAAPGAEPRALDDWVTFYEGATRLVEYLTYAGYNGAIVTVAADGGAIYPSKLLEPTPRYDDGAYFSTGQDPLRKDVLELLLRLFDREGLRLVPALQFTGRLPRLEAERRTAAVVGLPDPVSVRRPLAPRDAAPAGYDLLKPRVAAELTAIVAELAERYGRHPSLVGTAVQLSAEGSTQLAGIDAGADFAELQRFLKQQNVAPPQELAERDLAAWTIDGRRQAWLARRAEAVADFYGRLQVAAAGGVAERPLYLIAAHSWDSAESEGRLRPALPQTPVAEQLLLEAGLDPGALAKQTGVVWLRPYRSAPRLSLAQSATASEIHRAEGLDAAEAAAAVPGGLVFHEPLSARLASLERVSPYQPTYARFVAASAPVGPASRRLLVQQLVKFDAAAVTLGGWTLPLGNEAELRKFAGVVRSLPAEKFDTVRGGPAYVAVRTLSRGDRTYLYVANDAPWPTTVTLEIAAGRDCPWRAFTGSAEQTGWIDEAGTRRWQARLEPHDVVGGVFLQPDVEASSPAVSVEPEVAERMRARIQQLWAGATELQRASRGVELFDPGFERAAAAEADERGWQASGGFDVVAERPRSGERCARITTADDTRVVVGEPLQLGGAGRVALSVWLRAGEGQASALRLALIGTPEANSGVDGFYRYATVGGDSVTALDGEWRQFVFQVHDLPMAGIAHVQVRFETIGAGEVYLDDVRVVDCDFTEAERLQLSKMITLAEYKLERNELGDCAKLLDGYWPRYLDEHLPTTATGPEPAAAKVMTATREAPRRDPPPQPPPAGVRERLRNMLPSFLR